MKPLIVREDGAICTVDSKFFDAVKSRYIALSIGTKTFLEINGCLNDLLNASKKDKKELESCIAGLQETIKILDAKYPHLTDEIKSFDLKSGELGVIFKA